MDITTDGPTGDQNTPVSPGAYSELVSGIEEKAIGDPGFHVVFLGSGLDPEEEDTFDTREELDRWKETLQDDAFLLVITVPEEATSDR
jgi:hypothetical protein